MGGMSEVWRIQRLVESNFDTPQLRRVEELLTIWADDQISQDFCQGYKGVDSSCQDASSSMQWEVSTTEVISERTRPYVARAVEACVQDLTPESRRTLQVIYANTVGPRAWGNATPQQLKEKHAAAIRELYPVMRRRGLGVD